MFQNSNTGWMFGTAALVAVGLCLLAPSVFAANQVTVASRSVAPGASGISVGVFIENDVSLGGIVLPLEVRTIDGAFISGTFTLAAQGRITGDVLDNRVLYYYADPEEVNSCSGPISSTWATGSLEPSANGSPDAVLWVGSRMFGSVLPPGSDGGTPSLVFTFDIDETLGSLEIDSMCVTPANHVALVDYVGSDVPFGFNKGVITVEPNACPTDVEAAEDPLVGQAGSTVTNQISATDPEEDPIEYFLVTGPGAVDAATGEWTWTPECADMGVVDVTIEASDRGAGGCPTSTVAFAVEIMTSLLVSYCGPDLEVTWGEFAEQEILVSGGCPPYMVSVVSGPGIIGVDGNVWHLTTTCADVGVHTVEVAAEDDIGQIVFCTFNLEVTNSAPVCPGLPAQETPPGVPVAIELGPVTDADGQTLTYDLLEGTGWPGEVIIGNTYMVTRPLADGNSYTVEYEITDGCEPDFCLVDLTPPANQPPVLDPIPDQTVLAGGSLEFAVSATDPDGTIPTLEALNIPAGAGFIDSANGAGHFYFYPQHYQEGVYQVAFVASDGALADTEAVGITVVLGDSVIVESKKVALGATGVGLHVRLTNPTYVLWNLTVPLEIRSGSSGSFVTRLGMSYADRLGDFAAVPLHRTERFLDPLLPPCYDGSQGIPMLGLPPQPVAGSPEGVLFWREADYYWYSFQPGADADGSLVLTADVNSIPGTFSIVKTCLDYYEYRDTLAFYEGDYAYVPHFVPGLITINSPPVAWDTCIDVLYGTSATVQLPAYDADDPVSALTYTLEKPPSDGTTISFNPATGVYKYQAPGVIVTDSILFSVADGYDLSSVYRFCFNMIAAVPDTFWVSVDGSDGNAGTEASPFRTITHAMTMQSPNLTVMVKPGTYSEPTIWFPDVQVVKLVSTDGPFVTILTGDNTGGDGSIVAMESGNDFYVQELNGFTLRGNVVTQDFCEPCAGGVYVGSPTLAHIVNNIIIGNVGNGAAGGIEYYGYRGLVANNWIIGNVGVAHPPPVGGAAPPQPGGIRIGGEADAYLVNNTIAYNSASVDTAGAGVAVPGEWALRVFDNNVIAFNQPGVGFATDFDITTLPMWNCLYFGNGDPDDVPDGVLGPGPVTSWVYADPLFRDAAGDDYHLSCFSPARDVGRSATLTELPDELGMKLTRDIDRQLRTFNSVVDIGADEFYDDAKIASFQPQPPSGCAPLTVDFINESECLDEQWAWDFGDGTTLFGSGLVNKSPTHTFDTAGEYKVQLIALGDLDADTTYDTVSVGARFSADFETSDSSGCVPLAVTFTASATAGVDAVHWDFGDGGTAVSTPVVHTYDELGNYDVVLTLTNACTTVTVTKTQFISIQGPPVIDSVFSSYDTATAPICNPYTVEFAFSSDDVVNSARWDFGDGTRVTELSPTHTYAAGKPEGYSVEFVAYGDCDSTRIVKLNWIKLQTRPTAVPSARSPHVDTLFACANLDAVHFTAEITGDVAVPVWLFGDGQTAEGWTADYVYPDTGTYRPAIVIAHECGEDMIPLADNLVVGAQPVADFAVEVDSVYQPDPIVFTNLSLNNPIEWHWTFGDGDSSSVPSPTHEYEPGTYAVSLSVANPCGSDTTEDRTVRVGGFEPLIVDSLDAVGDTIFYSVRVDALVLAYDNPVYVSARTTTVPRRGSMAFVFTQSSGVPPYTAIMRAIRTSDLASGTYTIEMAAVDSLRLTAAQTPITKLATRRLTYQATAFLKIDPSPLPMGKAAIGNPISKDIVLSNVADHDSVVLQAPLIEGEYFAIFGSGGTLKPGESTRWTVQFSPVRKGEFTAKVRVRSNDPANGDSLVPVTAKAVSELRPPRVAITQPATGQELRIDRPLIFEFDERMRIVPLDTILLVRSTRTGESILGEPDFTDNRHASFVPTAWFAPDDTLSVQFRACVTDTNANYLDGDADGIEEGTPIDDFLATVPVGPGVYPGDTDNDGTVNERDILPLGRFYGYAGEGRDDDGTDFSLQPATAWVPREATYADANGDGDVDSMDVCPIADFFDSDTGLARLHLESWLAAAEQWPGDIVDALIAGLEYCPGEGQGYAALRGILQQLKQTAPRPTDYALAQNYPNPFNPTTVIAYTLPKGCEVRLEVFDVGGRRVVTLESGFKPAGRHWKVWDGRDAGGRPVASGVYFYRIETQEFRFARKMVLLK